MASANQILTCRDCGDEFVFSIGEQQFFAERGFLAPNRCPACRARRRMTRNAGGEFHSTGSHVGDGARGPRPLFPAVCADCGRDTMVPFEPRPGRAVYCRECFANHRSEYQ